MPTLDQVVVVWLYATGGILVIFGTLAIWGMVLGTAARFVCFVMWELGHRPRWAARYLDYCRGGDRYMSAYARSL